MAKINILDFSVANLIAAGEVVDRPASVAKELIENSIDAGASKITVEIARGGVGMIRVTDNGCGMAREDAEVCLLRHATSKIRDARDLDAILTLGFRGEALAATSSVSRMTIVTKSAAESVGTRLECDCGRITEVCDEGCKNGTTVTVRELFANVPARRKFLKRDQSEGMAVAAVVEKEALSHPEIAFTFTSDGTVKLQTSGDKKLYSAIYALLGRDFASKLIAVKGRSEAVEVFGYIGRPDNARANRNYQNFFINGRYIKSRTATAALEQAYSSFMESERFPCCVLNIVIHPTLVDVNVHPTKLEVKFSNEKTVFDAVYLAVRNALLNDTVRPEMQVEKKDIDQKAIGTYNRFVPVYDRLSDAKPDQTDIFEKQPEKPVKTGTEKNSVPPKPFDDLPFVFEDIVRQATGEQTVPPNAENGERSGKAEKNETGKVLPELKDDAIVLPQIPTIDYTQPIQRSMRETTFDESENTTNRQNAQNDSFLPPQSDVKTVGSESKNGDIPEFKFLGIAFETYILVEIGEKLMMIDKHAAHERLIFEKMKANMESGSERYVQLLLLPEKIAVGRNERCAAMDYEEDIKKAGFDFRVGEEDDTVELLGIPGGLEKDQALTLFGAMVTGLSSGETDAEVQRKNAFEKALYTASCKAAMKGSRHDDREHLEYIVRELLRLPDIRYCPHGRPVAFDIPKGSIEHKFKRS